MHPPPRRNASAPAIAPSSIAKRAINQSYSSNGGQQGRTSMVARPGPYPVARLSAHAATFAGAGYHRSVNACSAAFAASGAIASSATCFHLGTKTGLGTPSGRNFGARLFFGIGGAGFAASLGGDAASVLARQHEKCGLTSVPNAPLAAVHGGVLMPQAVQVDTRLLGHRLQAHLQRRSEATRAAGAAFADRSSGRTRRGGGEAAVDGARAFSSVLRALVEMRSRIQRSSRSQNTRLYCRLACCSVFTRRCENETV